MEESRVDFLVIGGGLMGSAAAWQLAKSGKQVMLLETQGKIYQHGSSFGEARICRSLGPKYDIFSYIHKKAVEETQTLIHFLNQENNVHQMNVHQMQDIYTDSPVTYLFHTNRKAGIDRMLQQQNDPYCCASNPKQGKQLFNVSLPETAMMIREKQPFTGTMNPQVLISKLHIAIGRLGQEVRYHSQVKSIRNNESGYVIQLGNEIIHANHVVSAVGPYTSQLVIPLFSIPSITPKRVALSFFQIDNDFYNELSSPEKQKLIDAFPLIDLGADHVFAMIEKMHDGAPLLKIGGHFRRDPIESIDDTWNEQISDEEKDWAVRQLVQYLKMNNIQLSEKELTYTQGYSCIYSLTENEIPIVKRLEENFVLMAGFSGVGAKGALTYGLIAKNLLTGEFIEDPMHDRTISALGAKV